MGSEMCIRDRSVACQGLTDADAVGWVGAKKRANGRRVCKGLEVSMGVLLLKLLWLKRGCLPARQQVLRTAVRGMVLQTVK